MAPTSTMIDPGPATTLMAAVVSGITDSQLDDPTPCLGVTVGQLLDHLDGLCQAFAHAAVKSTALNAPRASPTRPGSVRTGAVASRPLAELAEAWRDPAAWTGTSAAGGVEMPAPVTGRVAIDEVLVHGWDLARATGQRYEPDVAGLAAAAEFVDAIVAQSPEGSQGIVVPPVAVPADAPPLDRLLGATGRDPAWQRED